MQDKFVWIGALAVSLSALGLGTASASEADHPGVAEEPCALEEGPETTGMPSTERIFQWTKDMTSFGYRRTGTQANAQAAAYVKCRFEAMGLQDVHYETATSWRWEAERSSLSVNGRAIDSFPVAFSFITPDQPSVFSTGPAGLQTELVDIGSGSSLQTALTKVKGKIVVFDLKFQVSTAAFLPIMEFFWDPGLTMVERAAFAGNPYQTNLSSVVKRLMNAGAVGFVGVLSDYFDSNKYYNEFYRSTQVTIPGVWVTKSEGAVIRALMKAGGGRPAAKLVLDGRRDAVEARAVVGMLPGKSMDTILVTSHHDSVWNGAVEDASGTASVLAQLQYFASKPAASREKTMMFATLDSHFTGYQVHQALTQKYIVKKETPYTIVADVTLEHIGKQGVVKDGKLVMTGKTEVLGIMENLSPALKTTLKSSIKRHDLRRTAMLSSRLLCPTVGIPTDAFSCVAGVPTASLISGPVYLYDQADTIDKVATEQLQPVAKVFADLIEAIDKTPSNRIGR